MTALVVSPGPRLTPELAARLITGAQTGLFRGAVAEAAGLDPDVLDTWLEMGLSSGAVDPYRTFALAYRASEAQAQLPYVQSLQAAATVDWKAALAWLAVRWPEQWGQKATKNTQSGSLKPTAGDEAAEEELVDQLFEAMPPALRRVLAKRGITPPEPTVEAPPPRPPSD